MTPKKFRGITPEPTRFTLDVWNPDRAVLLAETAEDRAAREGMEADAAKLREVKVGEAVSRLREAEPFKRSLADSILKEVLPGWSGQSPRTLQRRTPEWLRENGFVESGEGNGRTYSYKAD